MNRRSFAHLARIHCPRSSCKLWAWRVPQQSWRWRKEERWSIKYSCLSCRGLLSTFWENPSKKILRANSIARNTSRGDTRYNTTMLDDRSSWTKANENTSTCREWGNCGDKGIGAIRERSWLCDVVKLHRVRVSRHVDNTDDEEEMKKETYN